MSEPHTPFQVKALYDYVSDHPDDLPFSANQIITVKVVEDEEWYTGSYTNSLGVQNEGMFPKNFVEILPPSPVPQIPQRPTRQDSSTASSDTPSTQVPKSPKYTAPAPAISEISQSKPIGSGLNSVLAAHKDDSDSEGSAWAEDEVESPVQPAHIVPSPPAPVPSIPKPISPKQEAPKIVSAKPPAPIPSIPPQQEQKSPSPPPLIPQTSLSTPQHEAKKGPKPVPKKKNAFLDRIAAFNKAGDAPVPKIAPKPQSFVRKPFIAAAPSSYVPQAPHDISHINKRNFELPRSMSPPPPPVALTSEADQADEGPKLSLKERIALLQKQQQEEADKAAAAIKRKKEKAEKRRQLEEAKAAQQAQEAEAQEESDSEGEKSEHESTEHPEPPVTSESASNTRQSVESARSTESIQSPDVVKPAEQSTDNEEEEEEEESSTEEEVDAEEARKLALRDRMAKISGGIGGMPMGLMMPGMSFGMPSTKEHKKKSHKKPKDTSDKVASQPIGLPMMPSPFAIPGMAAGAPPIPTADEDDSDEDEDLKQPEKAETEQSPAVIETSHEKPNDSDVEVIGEYVVPSVPGSSRELPSIPTISSSSHVNPTPSDLEEDECTSSSEKHTAQTSTKDANKKLFSSSDEYQNPDSKKTDAYDFSTLSKQLPDQSLSPIVIENHEISDDDDRELGDDEKTESEDNRQHLPSPPSIPTTTRPLPATPVRAPPPPIPLAVPVPPPSNTKRRSFAAPPVPMPGAPPPVPPTLQSPSSPHKTRPTHKYELSEEVTGYDADEDTDFIGVQSVEEVDSEIQLPPPHSLAPPVPIIPKAPLSNAPPPPLPTTTAPVSPPVPVPGARPPPPPTGIAPTSPLVPNKSRPLLNTTLSSSPPPDFEATSPLPGIRTLDPNSTLYRSASKKRSPPPPPPPQLQPRSLSGLGSPTMSPVERQGSNLSSTSTGSHLKNSVTPIDSFTSDPIVKRSIDVGRKSVSHNRRSVDIRKSIDQSHNGRSSFDVSSVSAMAVDINIEQEKGWWKNSGTLPPSLASRLDKDLIFESEDNTSSKRGGRTVMNRDLYVLFADYSQTTINIRYELSDPDGTVYIEQSHSAPPAPLRQDQYEDLASKYNQKVLSIATKLAGRALPTGELVTNIFSNIKGVLRPVGQKSFGALVYSNMSNATTKQNDEIRPGDIIVIKNGRFQTHKGPLHQKTISEVGINTPHVGIVNTWDGIKRKLKVIEQDRHSKVKLESYRLSEMRSGDIRIFRLVGRDYVDWEKS